MAMASESDTEIATKMVEIKPTVVQIDANEESGLLRSRAKVLPRYLQASQGSCHDLCKYGKKHEWGPKTEWVPIRKLIKEKRTYLRLMEANGESSDPVVIPAPKEHDSTDVSQTTLGEGLLEAVDNPKPVSVPKRPPLMRKASKVASVVDEGVAEKTLYVIESTLENNTRSSLLQNGLRRSTSNQAQASRSSPVPVLKRRSSLNEKIPLPSSSHVEKGLRRSSSYQVLCSTNSPVPFLKRRSTLDEKSRILSSSPVEKGLRRSTSDQVLISKTSKVPILKRRSTLDDKTQLPSSSPMGKGLRTSDQALSSRNSQVPFSKQRSTPRDKTQTPSSLSVEKGLRRSTSQQVRASRSSDIRFSKARSTLDDKTQIPSSPSVEKSIGRSMSDQVRASRSSHVPFSKARSTLHDKTQIPSSSRSVKSLRRSTRGEAHPTANSHFPSECIENKKKTFQPKLEKNAKEVDPKLGSRRSGVMASENKSKSAQRLSFRKGTILELRAENNNTPRRLKFRQAKHLRDNQNGRNSEAPFDQLSEANSNCSGNNSKAKPAEKVVSVGLEKRRNLERLAISKGSPRSTEGSVRRLRFRFKRREALFRPAASSKERVLLRHQSFSEGKKDAPILLNNVIEETASKLVESRKSKVKALVGAFETVISLHDTRPSAAAMVSSA